MAERVKLLGSSDGAEVYVDAENALRVYPKSDFEQARDAGYAYSWASLTYDPDANDTILGVENNDEARDLYIEKIYISCDTATQYVVHTSTGVTMAGTAVTGVNLNRNSSNTASATAKCDETGNGQQAVSYTGRLYSGRLVANVLLELDIGGDVVLPYDHTIGVDFTTASTAGNVTIVGYFK